MDPTLAAVLGVLMRWIHVASVVTLIGGFIYARFVLAPALASLPEAERESLGSKAVNAFRPWLITVVATTFGSGVYNYATKAQLSSDLPHVDGHQAAAGAAHLRFGDPVFGARRRTRPNATERRSSIVISGLIAIAIADYLRYLSLR